MAGEVAVDDEDNKELEYDETVTPAPAQAVTKADCAAATLLPHMLTIAD